MEYLVRFLVGGIVVSAFAVLSDVLRPKSFAGLFGAAPSLALATLSLALWKEGGAYVSVEGRSMILGAVALAGLGPAALAFNFHVPAAFVRLFALSKTLGKYGERVVGHRAAAWRARTDQWRPQIRDRASARA